MLSIVLKGHVIKNSLTLVKQKDMWLRGFKRIFLDNQENLLFMNISVHVRTVTLALSATFILYLKPTQIFKLK